MDRQIQLDATEARVFGVLIEKALTTPEQYPLSVNAATNGANQKSNRDPVLSLDEDHVQAALERLAARYLARKVFPANSRVERYLHNAKDALGLDAAQLAVMAELLLRGPQTPGELRGRASRMINIETLEQLTMVLESLIAHGFVQRLPPAPGSRAERYVQLLSPGLHPTEAPPAAKVEAPGLSAPVVDLAARVEALESELQRTRRQLESLARKLGHSLDE